MLRKIAVLLALSALSLQAQAGVVIGGTRFIYNEGKPSISFRVINQSPSRYLITSKILADDDPHAGVPFVATPPVFALNGHKENEIRVMYTSGQLPADRESLFWVTVANIPQADSQQQNTLQIAVRSRMKLFYRPKGVQGDSQQAYRQLRWQRQGKTVTVQNPTPFYVTLLNMQANGQSIAGAGMVAPFSSRTAAWCPAQGGCALQWQSLNDYGRAMPAMTVSPTAVAQKGDDMS